MKDYRFRWIAWNVAKCEKHNVRPQDAEYVVCTARRPFPAKVDDEKQIVWGQTRQREYLQVIYLIDPEGTLFVIHAMPMSEKQKHQLRRRRR